MKQYQELLQNILINGTWQENRTGIRTKMLPGAMLKFDLRDGFPAVTTKKLYMNAVVGELLGFLRGYHNVADFNKLGCKVWDANASAPKWLEGEYMTTRKSYLGDKIMEGELGRIYGVQWRDWNCSTEGQELDQIAKLLHTIENDPTNRRMIVSAWRPDEIDQMALPPCHYAFQVIIEQETKTMHLLWNQRSCDVFLGIPFNIASYALLLHILARVTGYRVGTLTGFLADVHIYENHLDQVAEQLSREPFPLPKLVLSESIVAYPKVSTLTGIEPMDIYLQNYQHHEPIKAHMAV